MKQVSEIRDIQGVLSAAAARRLGQPRYTGQWVTFDLIKYDNDYEVAKNIRCQHHRLGSRISVSSSGIYTAGMMRGEIPDVCKRCWMSSSGGWCDRWANGADRIPIAVLPPEWCPLLTSLYTGSDQ